MDILSDQKCWKIIEKVVFLIILLDLRHTLGVGFLKFQHLQHFKASNSDMSFQFISDDSLQELLYRYSPHLWPQIWAWGTSVYLLIVVAAAWSRDVERTAAIGGLWGTDEGWMTCRAFGNLGGRIVTDWSGFSVSGDFDFGFRRED